MKKLLIPIIIILISAGCAISEKNLLTSRKKVANLEMRTEQKSSGLPYPVDKEFATSTNGNMLVFVRDTGDNRPSENFGEGIDSYNQLIIRDLKGSKEIIIVRSGKLIDLKIINLPKDYPLDVLIGISDPRFSLDNSRVYFSAVAWVTSSAIFSIDLKTKHIKYITHGDLVEINKTSEFKENLVVEQRKFHEGGGVIFCKYTIDAENGKRHNNSEDCD